MRGIFFDTPGRRRWQGRPGRTGSRCLGPARSPAPASHQNPSCRRAAVQREHGCKSEESRVGTHNRQAMAGNMHRKASVQACRTGSPVAAHLATERKENAAAVLNMLGLTPQPAQCNAASMLVHMGGGPRGRATIHSRRPLLQRPPAADWNRPWPQIAGLRSGCVAAAGLRLAYLRRVGG